MEEILHQLRLVDYPIIYKVFYISGGCLEFLPSTVLCQIREFQKKKTPFKKQHGPLQKWWCVEFVEFGISLYIGGIPGPLTVEFVKV